MRLVLRPAVILALCAGMLDTGMPGESATAPAATVEAAAPAPLPSQLDEVLDEVHVIGTVPLKVEDFVARREVDSVLLSPQGTRLVVGHMARSTENSTRIPDGKRITLPSLEGRKPQLSLFAFPSMQPVGTSQSNRHLVGHTDIRWHSERRLLMQLDVPRRGFRPSIVPSGGLVIADVEGKTLMPVQYDPLGLIRDISPIELRGYMAEIVTDADGPLRVVEARTGTPDQVLIQTTRSDKNGNRFKYGAFEMDATSGALRRVAALPVEGGRFVTAAGWIALVAGVNARNERVVYYLPSDLRARERSKPQVSNWQLRVTSNRVSGLEPVAWTGTAEQFYALDGRELPTRAVVVWDAASDTRQVLYRHPDVDMEAAALDPSGQPWMFSGTDHYPVYWYPDPDHPLARLHHALVQRLPREQVEILNATDDYAYAVARISAGRRPPVFVVLDVKSMQPLRTFHTYPQLDGRRLARVDAIEFRARDGLMIRGYLTTPLGADGNPRRGMPLVVIAHEGLQGTPAGYQYDYERQLFAMQDYAVLQVNHRGLRGRGAAFVQAGEAEWGQAVQDDILDGVRWAIQDGVADARRICFFGSGYGAWSALAAATRAPGMFKCVVGVNGTYDASLIGKADAIESKALLMHQRQNVDFPFEQATALRAALREAGNAPQWEVIDRGESGILAPMYRADVYRIIFRFLDQQLRP